MIDHDRRLLFIHIARTGGTSVETALVGSDWWEIDPDSKHLSATQARQKYGEKIWDEYTTFSIVRNPWDRVVSMWATGWWEGRDYPPETLDPADLKKFILQLKPHSNERYESLFYHEILNEKLDFVLRFEQLNRDFESMLAAIGQPAVSLPHLEARKRNGYRTCYDKETASLLETRFSIDIQRHGYDF